MKKIALAVSMLSAVPILWMLQKVEYRSSDREPDEPRATASMSSPSSALEPSAPTRIEVARLDSASPENIPESKPESRPESAAEKAPRSPSEILPGVEWDFSTRAKDAATVLGNDALNPHHRELDREASKHLDDLLRDLSRTLIEPGIARESARSNYVSRQYDLGRLPVAVRENARGYRIPQSEDPEVEMGLVTRGGQTYTYANHWGDDPEYDRARLALYDAKCKAIATIQDYIEKRAGNSHPTSK